MRAQSRCGVCRSALVALLVFAVTAPAALATPGSARIVVQFTESVTGPASPEFIDELSDFVGVPLSYVHAAPEGRHIFNVTRVVNEAHLQRVLKLLSRREEVVSAAKESPLAHRQLGREALW